MSNVLAIDPGPDQSAWMLFGPNRIGLYGPKEMGIEENNLVLEAVARFARSGAWFVVEDMRYQRHLAGRVVNETSIWIGRFVQCWIDNGGGEWERVPRREVARHLTGDPVAKNSVIRAVLVSRWGKSDRDVKGTKNEPGPLYGVKTHLWSALALALAAAETKAAEIAHQTGITPQVPTRPEHLHPAVRHLDK